MNYRFCLHFRKFIQDTLMKNIHKISSWYRIGVFEEIYNWFHDISSTFRSKIEWKITVKKNYFAYVTLICFRIIKVDSFCCIDLHLCNKRKAATTFVKSRSLLRCITIITYRSASVTRRCGGFMMRWWRSFCC